MDWSTYLDLARELAKHETEAHQRSAVSRAYYAMYCIARDMLDVVGDFNPPRCGSDHVYLWNTFAEEPYRAIAIRDLGQRLREARTQADYENFISNLPYLVEGAILDAEELKDALETP